MPSTCGCLDYFLFVVLFAVTGVCTDCLQMYSGILGGSASAV